MKQAALLMVEFLCAVAVEAIYLAALIAGIRHFTGRFFVVGAVVVVLFSIAVYMVFLRKTPTLKEKHPIWSILLIICGWPLVIFMNWQAEENAE